MKFEQQLKEKHNQPVTKYRAGGMDCAVWSNINEEGNHYFTVTLMRSYKNKAGEWSKTSSLNQNDLPKAILLLQKAYEALVLKQSGED